MTLAQLRYLLAIVDGGLNITIAAARVNATQPGLSKQLKLLEDELGLQLFVRRGRNLEKLTVAGEEVVERARIIVAEAANIRSFAANQRSDSSGSLVIETTHIQAQCVLPHVLPALRVRYPDLAIELGFAADSGDASRYNPDADVLLFSTDGRLPAGDVAIPLYQWEQLAIVPPHHPLALAGEAPGLGDLARFPLITYDTSKTAPLSLARTFLEAGFTPRFAYALRDAEVIKTMTRRGMGVGLLAEMGVDPDGEEDLAIIPLAGLFPRCTTWAVLRRDRVLREPLAALLTLLSGHAGHAIMRAAHGEGNFQTDTLPNWRERLALLSNATLDTRAAGSGRSVSPASRLEVDS